MFKYSINLTWSDEDESYVATIPEFPGLSAFGDTPSEAAEEAKIAANGFIKVYKEEGRPMPEPIRLTPFSGQLRIRIPKSLHESLSLQAKKEDISLNTYICSLLSEKNAYNRVEKQIEKINRAMVIHNSTKIPETSESLIIENSYIANDKKPVIGWIPPEINPLISRH